MPLAERAGPTPERRVALHEHPPGRLAAPQLTW